ncbi:DoxX family protein [Solicola gregarius]|uniref:DoxX family protein n=1 Tax=Solicola gregarius TaxID=2908642 RepID=A0AA46TL53_9ACTN|nr:DoxX family protein [Solicola gregarius]UYM07296.1 DoxX family protein [Solicola gregarius]
MSHAVLDRPHRHEPTDRRRPIDTVVMRASEWLNAHSITALRVSLGITFLAFGVLKFFPGVSPAEDLSIATIDKLTFGVISGSAALLLTAVTETVIGLTLTTGRFLRVGLIVLAGALVGIMSPLVLFPGDLLGDGPTLTAQYVFKDIVLAAGGLVVGAYALGGRLRRDS